MRKALLTFEVVMVLVSVIWGIEQVRLRRRNAIGQALLALALASLAFLTLALTAHFARAEVPGNFLAGIRSINVVMHRDRGARSKRHLVFAVRQGGKIIWYDTADAMLFPRAECQRYAKSYGDGVEARCYRRMPR